MGIPRRVPVLTLALGLAMSGCGRDPLAPEDILSEKIESAHFIYLMAPGDAVDTVQQERHYTWAIQKLGLTPTAKIEFRKYRDQKHMDRVTGHDMGSGFAEPGTYRFHTIWPWDNHEYIHAVFTTLVGLPPSFFNEGVAVAHHGASISGTFDGDPLWNGSSAHDQARAMYVAGILPGLDALIVTTSFWKLDQQKTYAIAGSFVRFLIDEAGMDSFRAFAARSGEGDSASRIRSDFDAVYGESLEAWWTRWLNFLVSR